MIISEQWTRSGGSLSAAEMLKLVGTSAATLLYGEGAWLIAGWDPLVTFTQPATRLGIERSGAVPPIHPDLMGFLSYEFGYLLDPALPPLPPGAGPLCHFDVFRHVVLCHRPTREIYRGLRRCEPAVSPPDLAVDLAEVPFQARKMGGTDSRATYMEKVATIRAEIAAGNVYQVDLTRLEKWEVAGDAREFALRLHRENPAPFSAYLQQPDFTIVSSSPEQFLSLREGRFQAGPIKGTAPRGSNAQEDARWARFLIDDVKNRSELAMIVDLLRNDLSAICRPGSVQVLDFPRLESFTNVHHLVAHITGLARDDVTLAQILKGTFPGGSITGCPKIAAMRFIRELESEPRGVYTGAIGWMSADAAMIDLNIAIRTCTIRDGMLTFGVGGGVVWDSDPAAEYEETVKKGESIVKCLN